MRIPGWLHLLTLCLLAGGFQASCSLAQAGPKPVEPKKFVIKEEFTGYGETVTQAQTDAMARGCQWLEEHSGLSWSPDTVYLRQHNMVHFDEPTDEKFEHAGTMKVVKMQLQITAEQARDMQKQAQQERMKSRQGLSLLVLVGLVGLVGIVGGYLWLEEATKGYYTRMLRLAAIGILILIGLGLCVIA
jgi:hypothetical protein